MCDATNIKPDNILEQAIVTLACSPEDHRSDRLQGEDNKRGFIDIGVLNGTAHDLPWGHL
eukprot:1141660-Amphidinium_carterae.1